MATGMVCLTCQPLLVRYGRNRSLLSRLMPLMLLTVTVIAGPSLLSFLFLPSVHPPCLSPAGLRPFRPRWGPFETTVNYYLNSRTSWIHAIFRAVPEKQPTQEISETAIEGRRSPRDSHHLSIHIFSLTKWCMLLSDICCPQSSVA